MDKLFYFFFSVAFFLTFMFTFRWNELNGQWLLIEIDKKKNVIMPNWMTQIVWHYFFFLLLPIIICILFKSSSGFFLNHCFVFIRFVLSIAIICVALFVFHRHTYRETKKVRLLEMKMDRKKRGESVRSFDIIVLNTQCLDHTVSIGWYAMQTTSMWSFFWNLFKNPNKSN